MGIFDVFKTKVNEAAEKAGGKAEQAKDQAPTGTVPGAEASTEARASNMVYEGGPVSATGEAAPGIGDDDGSAPHKASGGGMTQSIKDNAAKGTEKAGEMAKGATGNRYDEKIDSAVRQAKGKLR